MGKTPEKIKRYKAKIYAKHRAEGLCVACGPINPRSAKPGFRRCTEHLAVARNASKKSRRKRRGEWREQDKCLDCGRDRALGDYCEKHSSPKGGPRQVAHHRETIFGEIPKMTQDDLKSLLVRLSRQLVMLDTILTGKNKKMQKVFDQWGTLFVPCFTIPELKRRTRRWIAAVKSELSARHPSTY